MCTDPLLALSWQVSPGAMQISTILTPSWGAGASFMGLSPPRCLLRAEPLPGQVEPQMEKLAHG